MADKRHNFTRTEISAGLMVIVSVAVLAGFIAMVQGWEPPRDVHTFYCKFTGTNGLSENAGVYWGGLKCGNVDSIAPDPESQSQIRVSFSVEPGIPVNAMSVASVEQVSLTSERHLELSTGTDDAARLDPGSEVRANSKGYGFIELPDLNGVIDRVKQTLDSGRKLVEDLTEAIGVDDAKEKEEAGEAEFVRVTQLLGTVNGMLGEAEGMVVDLRDTIAAERPNITAILTKVQGIEDSAQEMVEELNGLIAENRPVINSALVGVDDVLGKVGGMVDSVAAELDSLVKVLEQTLGNVENLTGTANDFLESNRADLDDIVRSLKETVRNLEGFSRTLEEQPQSLVRGAKPTGR